MVVWSPILLWLIPVGLLTGCFGGMLGIGGSILMIPAMMLLLGPDLHVYQGAAMIVNFFVVVPATLQHIRRGAVMPGIVRVTIPAAAATVLLGVWVSESPWFRGANAIHLSRLFGVFLWYEAAFNLWRAFAKRKLTMPEPELERLPAAWRIAAFVGLPTGFVGGLLGVGGGIAALPTQQVFLRVPVRRAIANSAATIVCLSAIGATFKNITLIREGVPPARMLVLAALLIPTAVVGGYWGAQLTHRVPLRLLRLCLVVLMGYAGWKLMLR
jgi:uncharacterized membrane protein YfcA